MAGLTPYTVQPQVGVNPATGASAVSWAYPSQATSLDLSTIISPMITIMMLGMLFGMMKPMMQQSSS